MSRLPTPRRMFSCSLGSGSLGSCSLGSCALVGCLALASACGGESKPQAAKEAPAADAAKKAPAADDAAEAKEAAPAEVKLAFPWIRERVIAAMTPGTTLTYKLSGSDAKGKEIADDYRCEVKKADERTVGTVCNTVNKPSTDKGANEIATRDWGKFSPFFAVEKPEATLVEVADVSVPAGDFKTVVVELKDFFGANFKVWMIADKPGIYAKVEEGPRGPDDKTAKIYELASIESGG